MVITILEARVANERVGDLENDYHQGTEHLPAEIVDTFLVRDAADENLFRIVTVWVSREDLETMCASVEKPKGVQMFEGAGAKPKLSVQDVLVHARGNGY